MFMILIRNLFVAVQFGCAFMLVWFGSIAMAQQPSIDLTGVIDFHAHAGPDSRPRAFNDFEAARLAKQAGLRGIVLKNHFTMTADRAALAMSLVDGLEIFGGVALNRAVGGINPEAVRQMVAFDGGRGRVVWLPTFDAEFYVTRAGQGDPFVRIVENGAPVPALLEVFSLIAEHELVLAMGHSSPQEVFLLIPIADNLGVTPILITHVFGQDARPQQVQCVGSNTTAVQGQGTVGMNKVLRVACGHDRCGCKLLLRGVNYRTRRRAFPDLSGFRPGRQPGPWHRHGRLHPGSAGGWNYRVSD